ncbi:MAG: hypothetical protein ACKOXK_07645 [Chakrabartia sp.]
MKRKSTLNARLAAVSLIALQIVACDGPATTSSTDATNESALAPKSPSAPAAKAPGKNDKLLQFATSNEVIGMNPDYVEKQLGIPRSKSDRSLEYNIDSCQISYSVEGTAITGFSVSLGPQCAPTIDGERVSNKTSFGDLLRRASGGEISATCLTSCGNAADPTILLSYGGYHYNNFIGVTYYTDYSQAGDALSAWETAVRKSLGLSASDYIDDYTPFLDAKNPPSQIKNQILRMKVTDIYVKRD